MRSRTSGAVLAATLAFAPGVSAQHFQPIGIGCIANLEHTKISGPNATYGRLPVGRVTLGGVPFSIPESGKNIWHSVFAAGPNPRSAEVEIGIAGVTEVHTLMNTYWGVGGPSSYASIEFFGSKGARHTVALIGDSDMRDFAAYVFTNRINNTTTVQVWSDRGARLDKQKFVLPAAFATQTLTKVRFSDNGGDGMQRIFVMGLTVKSPQTPIIGQTKDLGGSCGSGGKCTVGGTLSLGARMDIQLTGADSAAQLGIVNLNAPSAPLTCGSCSILPPLLLLPAAVTKGNARVDLVIPCDRRLLAGSFDTQWLVMVTGPSPCPLVPGLSASNRVRVTIGY